MKTLGLYSKKLLSLIWHYFLFLADGVIDLSCDKNIASIVYNEVMKKTDNLGADIVLDLDSKVIE